MQQQRNWESVGGEDYGVWDGQVVAPGQQPVQHIQPIQPAQQLNQRHGATHPDAFLHNNDRVFTNQWGQRCRIVCEPNRPRPRPRPVNLQMVSRSILGQNLVVAQRSHPNVVIRPVIQNGQHLPATMDFIQNRINVGVDRHNRINQIVSFN